MHNVTAQKTANILKTGFLFLAFSAVALVAGYLLSSFYGNPTILIVAVGFTLVTTAFSYFASDRIAIATSGAKPVTAQQEPELHAIVARLAAAARIPTPRLYVTEDAQINAFATGRNPANAAVAVTRGALERLSSAELEGVLGHELSHVLNRDILVSSVAVVLAGAVATASQFLGNSLLFGGRDREDRSPLSMLLSVALILLAPIGATIMQLAISRRRESLADISGSQLTGKPGDLADALEKIGKDAYPLRGASDATAHLWISSPFKGKQALGFVHRLFMTHPPIEERVAALRAMSKA